MSVKSQFKEIKTGILQGSKLGPILCLLYLNDIIQDIESEFLLFADDTCCFAVETAVITNKDLGRLDVWTRKLNVIFIPKKRKDKKSEKGMF